MMSSGGSPGFQGMLLKKAIAVPVAGIAIVSAPRAHEGESTKAVDPDPVVEILLLNAAAVERGDLGALNNLWGEDDSLVVFENGYANHGWADYRDHHLVPELAEMRNVKYRLSDIKTHPSGEIAWATFKYTISADLADRHVEGAGVGTAVLGNQGSSWRILHWHTSSPRKPPSGAHDRTTP